MERIEPVINEIVGREIQLCARLTTMRGNFVSSYLTINDKRRFPFVVLTGSPQNVPAKKQTVPAEHEISMLVLDASGCLRDPTTGICVTNARVLNTNVRNFKEEEVLNIIQGSALKTFPNQPYLKQYIKERSFIGVVTLQIVDTKTEHKLEFLSCTPQVFEIITQKS